MEIPNQKIASNSYLLFTKIICIVGPKQKF